MRVLDLFSGIGGFSLGLEATGRFSTAGFVERDEFCRKVLRKHWPHVPQHDDIHTYQAGQFGSIDVVAGGFPCQPFSQAGKQRSKEDDRYLWPEMLRVIEQERPAWVIGENVPGIVSLALDDVLFDLEAIGYSSRTFAIPACAVDAPHRRDRIWIVAHAEKLHGNGSDDIPSVLMEGREVSEPRDSGGTQDLADSHRRRQPGSREFVVSSHCEAGGERQAINALNGGVGSIWEPEPGVGRVAHGIPRRVDRLRSLGNAVVPQVVFQIGRMIAAQ